MKRNKRWVEPAWLWAPVIACAWGHAAGAADPPVVEVSSLKVKAGETVNVSLHLPSNDDWTSANVGRFMVRNGARQKYLEPGASAAKDRPFSLTLDQPGWTLLAVDVGPTTEKGKSDSWRRTPYCAKFVIDARRRDGQPASSGGSGATSKIGAVIEVLPLMDPVTIRPGGDLPVRVYFEGSAQKNQNVIALAPDGTRVVAVGDDMGIANVRVSQAGRWTLRFEKEVNETTYVADLVFDVQADSNVAPAQPKGDRS